MVRRSSRPGAAARQQPTKKKQSSTKTSSREIMSLDQLKAVQYRIFHHLKIDHPRTLFMVDKHLHKELVPAVYKNINVSGHGFYKLLRVLVTSKRRNSDWNIEPVYNSRMVEALQHTLLLKISDFNDYKKLYELLSLCRRPYYGECKNDSIFPNLKHIALGSNTLEGTEKLEIVQILTEIWSVRTSCIDWPKTNTNTTDIVPKEKTLIDFEHIEGEPDDVILDWNLVELLDHVFPLDTKLESIKIHLSINDLGNLLHRLLDYKPQFWESRKPKIILDFIDTPEQLPQYVYFTVMAIYITVIRAMKDYDYRDLSDQYVTWLFDKRIISLQVYDNGNKEAELKDVEDDLGEEYRRGLDSIRKAIVWKQKDKVGDWKCPCGKYHADMRT